MDLSTKSSGWSIFENQELKDIEIMSEDEEPLGQEEQKNIDEEMKRKRQMKIKHYSVQ